MMFRHRRHHQKIQTVVATRSRRKIKSKFKDDQRSRKIPFMVLNEVDSIAWSENSFSVIAI